MVPRQANEVGVNLVGALAFAVTGTAPALASITYLIFLFPAVLMFVGGLWARGLFPSRPLGVVC